MNCLKLQAGGTLLLQDGSGCLLLQAEMEAVEQPSGGWTGFAFDRIRKALPEEIPLPIVIEALESQPLAVRNLPQVPEVLNVLKELDREALVKEVSAEIVEGLPDVSIDRELQLEFALLRVLDLIEDELESMLLLDIGFEIQQQPVTIAELLLLLA
ncbi:MAG: hypothetical protein GY942_03190 [Aestuariibacter sp.]|nr:hypothetical protein [Aestuariibacter sp.]